MAKGKSKGRKQRRSPQSPAKSASPAVNPPQPRRPWALALAAVVLTIAVGLAGYQTARSGASDAAAEAEVVESGAQPAATATPWVHLTIATFDLPGFDCASCVPKIKRALEAHPGIKTVVIDESQRLAYITFRPDRITSEEIGRMFADLGHKATPRRS